MRFVSLLVVALVSGGLVTACSNAADSSLRRTSHPADPTSTGGGAATSPAVSTEDSTHQGGAASPPAATAPKAPATPLRAGVCENPTCTVQNGACGCTATNTEGVAVSMDCQDGVCECVTGNEITTQVSDDNCASDGDARTIYSANCGCL